MKEDPDLWTRKAMAFTTRCHRHLWGKNNEDPLSFLYLQGLSIDFSRSVYLGWNKFAQERSYVNWGIRGDGKFLIPAGIVFPYIVNKDLKSVFIIPMTPGGREFSIPGSDPDPVILRPPENGTTEESVINSRSMLQGLVLFQNKPGLRVEIPHFQGL